ncbi:MAG: rRNA maturation RNase YbeY [Gammaproteobacteria bacterium]|nr:rRNA maturation RNase YbeY [Gammaproteobacteria bacterium]
MTREQPKVGDTPRDARDVDIQWGLAKREDFPEDAAMVGWVEAALESAGRDDVAVSIRIMDREEIALLNENYRENPVSTNVLSFPAEGEDEDGRQLLGDIALCSDVIVDEASEQGKTLSAHVSHMLVHGVLHLLGYDHMEEEEAVVMERLETDLLDGFGFPDPYDCVTGRGGQR